jgi:cytoskeleton protein RodZ
MTLKMNPSPVKDVSTESFGVLLERQRTLLGLSLQDVSSQLLLSTNQVRGLEADNHQAFYNDWFYVQATKKYANFLNLPLPAAIVQSLDQAALTNKAYTGRLGLAQHPEYQPGLGKFDINPAKNSHLSATIAASLVVVGVLVGFVAFNEFKSNNDVVAQTESIESVEVLAKASDLVETPPEATVALNTEMPESQNLVTEALARATENPILPAPVVSELTLTFSGDCWVQAISADGTRIEKIYKQGETLQLSLGSLKSLVLGNATATSMAAGPVAVPLGDFTVHGGVVARILATDLLTHIDRTN